MIKRIFDFFKNNNEVQKELTEIKPGIIEEKKEIDPFHLKYDKKKTLKKIFTENREIQNMKLDIENDEITIYGKNVFLYGAYGEKKGNYIFVHDENNAYFIKGNNIILIIKEKIFVFDSDLTNGGFLACVVNLGFESNNRYSILFFQDNKFLGEKLENMTIMNLKIIGKNTVVYEVFNEEKHKNELIVSNLLNELLRVDMLIKGNYTVEKQESILLLKDAKNFIWKIDLKTGKTLNTSLEIENYKKSVMTPWEQFDNIKLYFKENKLKDLSMEEILKREKEILKLLDQNISDYSKAYLNRYLGEINENKGEVRKALEYYKIAFKLNEKVGVKKKIEKLEKED